MYGIDMKVIFLDIDGVLNSDRSIFALHMREIKEGQYRYNYLVSKTDPIAVAILNKIIKETNAKIVVSSANRKVFGMEIAGVLSDMGVEGEVIGITGTTGRNRGSEIADWLKFNQMSFSGDLTKNYVILDDSNDMLLSQQENFVRVNPEMGLSFNDMRKAIEILNGEAPTSLILI